MFLICSISRFRQLGIQVDVKAMVANYLSRDAEGFFNFGQVSVIY
jgi:hypothetical protein